MSYTWTCKGCLIKAGYDPDTVTESCIARFGDITCHFCGHVQDQSWFKHVTEPEVIKKLSARFQADVNRGAHVPNDLMGTVKVEVVQKHPPVSPDLSSLIKPKKYPDKCSTCGGTYSKGVLTFCSNGFHCCRDCVWEDGMVTQACSDHQEPAPFCKQDIQRMLEK